MKRILALFVSFGYFLLTYSLEYHSKFIMLLMER